MPEVEEAVVQKIHEVWHFAQRSTTLFDEFIDTFLKLKQEASGWPAWVGQDPVKRQQYMKHEGVHLDADKIEKNPGRQSLAKFMLNSFWGKYGQQSNKTQVKVCQRPSDLYPPLKDAVQYRHVE